MANWTVIFLYPFLRKWKYLTLFQKITMPLMCLGFITIDSTLFNVVKFETDWYFVLFYVTQFVTQVFLAISFKQRELKIDKLHEAEMFLETFKAVADMLHRKVWILDYHTHEMVYSNPFYKNMDNDFDGRALDECFKKEFVKVYLSNNDKAFAKKDIFHEFTEPTTLGDRQYWKMAKIIGDKCYIIGLGQYEN